MLREGALASYIGPLAGGLVAGERCMVLSDEGVFSNVRWVTGALDGQYTRVRNNWLVSDRKTKYSAFDDDEFGFEAEAPRAVRVACASVHAVSGNIGLMRALDYDGVLEGARILARRAVASVHEALSADPSWREVVSELGESGEHFLTAVMNDAFSGAMNGDRDVDVAQEEL